MIIFVLFVAVLLFVFCLPLRIFVFNFFSAVRNGLKDIYFYFVHKSWRVAPVGFINAYTGLFGYGKTLSAVHYVVKYFQKYNGVTIWDFQRKCFVTQYVNVLSNVKLSIPYTEFRSLSQIVDISRSVSSINDENNAKFVTIVLGDEFSTQLNSRNFKNNLDALTLNTILTCRHYGISLIYTAQRFGHVDALLRQVTSKVIECHKLWRLQCHNIYDAWDLEQTGSSLKIKPLSRTGFFVTDRDYNAYDSLAVVDNLVKDWQNGGLSTSVEILIAQGNSVYSDNNSSRLRRKFRKNNIS